MQAERASRNLDNYKKISPAFIQRLRKVNYQVAEEMFFEELRKRQEHAKKMAKEYWEKQCL